MDPWKTPTRGLDLQLDDTCRKDRLADEAPKRSVPPARRTPNRHRTMPAEDGGYFFPHVGEFLGGERRFARVLAVRIQVSFRIGWRRRS